MKQISLICIGAFSLLIGIQTAVSAPGDSVRTKLYKGPYPVNELGGTTTNSPYLDVDGIMILPLADEQTDLTIPLQGDTQIWNLLAELTPWRDVNRFGFYTDLNEGNNRTIIFEGSDDPVFQIIMDLSPVEAGLWLHNDTNNDSLFNGDDSFLYSQRNLTRGSACPEHQWFMVYDVSSYIGTNAQYNFHCNTENFSTTGDFHYLVFIDDDHTSANFDHNDMILGILYDSAPVIICPPDLTVECSESTDPSNTGFATAVDDLDQYPTITYSDSQDGNTISRTWTATDYNGNSSSCVQLITIVDSTPPSITCPDDISVQCIADVPLPNIDGVLSDDNCDPSPVITHMDDISDGSSCPETITRTYRATDSAGNFAECVQIITVMDDTPPQISCPVNVTVDCAESTDPSNTGFATAGDNCGVAGVDYTDNQVDNVITRTWTATDACGNTDQCVQTITLEDTSPPAITCPADFSIQCITDLPPPNVDGVIVADDCDPDPTVTHEGDVSDGNTCPEIITRTFRATDAAGNYTECDQTIAILDDIAPDITCPADIAIDCDESTDPENTGYATASDNCDSSPEVSYSDVTGENQITRTWISADDCDNYSTECVQTITINENLPPVIECPVDAIVVVVDDLEAEVCFSDIPCYDPDNEIATTEVNGVLMSGSDICFVPQNWGINTVTIICTDVCGAQTSCEFTVIVGACIFLPGDANVDGEVNIADVLDILSYLQGLGPLPGGECDCTPDVPFVPFYGAADVNGSCAVNVADVVYLYDYLRGTETALFYCPLCPPTEGWLPPPLPGGNPGGELPVWEMTIPAINK